MNTISVIVTYNGAKWIKKCLDSIINESQIVVIDNGSTDSTLEIIKSNYLSVHLIESQENLGFGAGNNIGILYALEQGAEFVILLNQDAWLQPGSLELLVKSSKDNPGYGVLSPIQLNGIGDSLDNSFGGYLYYGGGRKFITDKICDRESQDIVDIDFVNAAAWLLSVECIKKVGLFDGLFFHYGEDNNYLQRVRYHGYKIGVVGSSYVYHDREGNANTYFKNDFSSEIREKKICWADTNTDEDKIESEVKRIVVSRKKAAIKQLLQWRISNYRKLKKESEELRLIGIMSLESRRKNLIDWRN